MPEAGTLTLVATPIGNLGDITLRAIEVLKEADVILAEDTRHSRRLLQHLGIATPLEPYHDHNEARVTPALVERLQGGARMALITDAGTPGISDPGERLVRACVDAGLPVEVVPGPSAVLTALVLSGFDTARFVFEGFLPRRGPSRRERVAALASERRTAVLFEAPNRVLATLSDLLAACGPLREVAIARELTKLHEEVWRGELSDAVARATTVEARGEHVIVLAPAPEPPAASDAEVDAHVQAALTEGLSSRDASARVARDLGVPRRRVYDAATRLRRARDTNP